MLLAYASILESNEVFMGYTPRSSFPLFLMAATATAVLFFSFALLDFRSNIAILDLCRRYQTVGIQEVLSVSSKLPHWFSGEDSPAISTGHLRQILSGDVTNRSRMMRILLRILIPVARMGVGGAIIFYINPMFTVLIFVVIGVPIAGLYWIVRRIADTVTIAEKTSDNVFRRQLELLSENWEKKTELPVDAVDWEMALGVQNSRARLYYGRMKAKAQARLLINMTNILGLIVLILALGYWVLSGEENNWSLWIGYLVALRYFLSSLQMVIQQIVQSSRFARQVRRFQEFMAAATVAVSSSDPSVVPCPRSVSEAYQGGAALVDDDGFEGD